MHGLQVVYVHYHTVELIVRSVASVLTDAADLPAVEITVVDNSCDDDAWERLEAGLPDRVDRVRMADNVGFSAGCNRGVERGRASHLLFLNPDTVMPAGSLAALWRAIVAEGDRALVGPRHYADLARQFWHAPVRGARLFDEAWDAVWARGWCPGRPGRYLDARWRLHRRAGPVALRSISGGCLGTSRALYRRLGGFDEGYWLYGEDVDLCVRAWRRGARVLHHPEIPVVHFMEKSASLLPERVSASRQIGRERFKDRRYGAAAHRLERRLTDGIVRFLPARRDPWRGIPDWPGDDLSAATPGAPWAVELARSPLFDNCLTCFPTGDRLPAEEVPIHDLPPGSYHLRVADRVGGSFRERAQWMVAAPDRPPHHPGGL